MSHKKIGVAILGCGTVGGGVAALLLQQRALIRRRTGLDINLLHVAERDTSKHGEVPGAPYCTDAAAAIDDPRTDIVVELIGGTGAAAQFVERALRLGKPVVTANKSLLAPAAPNSSPSRKSTTPASASKPVAPAAFPSLTPDHGLVANRIDALVGIVNGTCNFILTQMTQHGWSYAQALAEAQKPASPKPIRRWTSPAATPRRNSRSSPASPSTSAWPNPTSTSKGIDASRRPT
jgi:homoserine dehydrogenase